MSVWINTFTTPAAWIWFSGYSIKTLKLLNYYFFNCYFFKNIYFKISMKTKS